jgi:hypothetical protein
VLTISSMLVDGVRAISCKRPRRVAQTSRMYAQASVCGSHSMDPLQIARFVFRNHPRNDCENKRGVSFRGSICNRFGSTSRWFERSEGLGGAWFEVFKGCVFFGGDEVPTE